MQSRGATEKRLVTKFDENLREHSQGEENA